MTGTDANAASQPDVSRSSGLDVPRVSLHITLTAALEVQVLAPRRVASTHAYEGKVIEPRHSNGRHIHMACSRIYGRPYYTKQCPRLPFLHTEAVLAIRHVTSCLGNVESARPGFSPPASGQDMALTRGAVAIYASAAAGVAFGLRGPSPKAANLCERCFPGRISNTQCRPRAR